MPAGGICFEHPFHARQSAADGWIRACPDRRCDQTGAELSGTVSTGPCNERLHAASTIENTGCSPHTPNRLPGLGKVRLRGGSWPQGHGPTTPGHRPRQTASRTGIKKIVPSARLHAKRRNGRSGGTDLKACAKMDDMRHCTRPANAMAFSQRHLMEIISLMTPLMQPTARTRPVRLNTAPDGSGTRARRACAAPGVGPTRLAGKASERSGVHRVSACSRTGANVAPQSIQVLPN